MPRTTQLEGVRPRSHLEATLSFLTRGRPLPSAARTQEGDEANGQGAVREGCLEEEAWPRLWDREGVM